MNYMYITIQCSNCGKRRRISTNVPDGVIKPVRQGWNSCGNAPGRGKIAMGTGPWLVRNTRWI